MSELQALEEWIGGLMFRLEPAQRVKLARAVAQDLRRSQTRRITAQRNPDGSAFEPRKRAGGTKGLRKRKGRLRQRAAERQAGPMFRKLRQAKYLRTEASADMAAAGFAPGATTRIARVHQAGLSDRVVRSSDAKVVKYPERVLLGFTDQDREQLMARVMEHLQL